MSHTPLNGERVLNKVEGALRSPAHLIRKALSEEAPDGTNGATKSSRAVDPSQGMGATRPRGSRDPLLAAVNKIVNR